jgi:hypothetical protein
MILFKTILHLRLYRYKVSKNQYIFIVENIMYYLLDHYFVTIKHAAHNYLFVNFS